MDVNAIYNVKCWPKAHLYAQVNFFRLQSTEMSRTQFLMIQPWFEPEISCIKYGVIHVASCQTL